MRSIPERIKAGEFDTASTRPGAVAAKNHEFRIACLQDLGVHENPKSDKVFRALWRHFKEKGRLAVFRAFADIMETMTDE